MKSKKNAPPGGDPGGAKASFQNKRRSPLDSLVAEIRQGLVSVFDGGLVSARIVFSKGNALLFVARADGLRQIGGIYPNHRAAFAALGEVA